MIYKILNLLKRVKKNSMVMVSVLSPNQIAVRRFLLGSCVFVSCYLSIFLAQTLIERYFFDTLIYRKSVSYGYKYENIAENLITTPPSVTKRRLRDLLSLIHTLDSSSEITIPGWTSIKEPTFNLSSWLKEKKVIQLSPQNLGNSVSPQETFTIVVVGDSMSYGLGVKEEDVFSTLLEKKLNEIRPTKVFNLSLPGDSVLDNAVKVEMAQKQLSPDLFVVGIVDNDLDFGHPNRYPGGTDLFQKFSEHCPGKQFVFSWRSEISSSDQLNELYYPSFSDQFNNSCILEESVKYILQSNSKVVFFPFSPIESDNAEIFQNEDYAKQVEIMNKYQNIIIRNGGKVLNYSSHYFTYEPVSDAEGHPSKTTHAAYSSLLFDEIVSNSIWHFEK